MIYGFPFEAAYIFGAAIQQRVVKTASSLKQLCSEVVVCAEENAVEGLFDNYLSGLSCKTIPVTTSRLRRTPLGKERRDYIDRIIRELGESKKKTLIIARDVNYGYLVGAVIDKYEFDNITYIVDIADNYDLLYDSYRGIKRVAFKIGFGYLTRKALSYAQGILIVCPNNKPRLQDKYSQELRGKPVAVLRNVPIEFHEIHNAEKIPNSFVYVGKIDETSRDPMYVLDKLIELPEYSLHFYSSNRKDSITRIKQRAKELSILDRVVFHDRVPYDKLAEEISKYQFGLVPHKRCLITDYTLPNKMYDYKSSGLISILSSCPSLILENHEYLFGLNYDRDRDDFVSVVRSAEGYTLDYSRHIPNWSEEFDRALSEIVGNPNAVAR